MACLSVYQYACMFVYDEPLVSGVSVAHAPALRARYRLHDPLAVGPSLGLLRKQRVLSRKHVRRRPKIGTIGLVLLPFFLDGSLSECGVISYRTRTEHSRGKKVESTIRCHVFAIRIDKRGLGHKPLRVHTKTTIISFSGTVRKFVENVCVHQCSRQAVLLTLHLIESYDAFYCCSILYTK